MGLSRRMLIPRRRHLLLMSNSTAGKEAGNGEPTCSNVLCGVPCTITNLATGKAIHNTCNIGPDDDCRLRHPGWQLLRF